MSTPAAPALRTYRSGWTQVVGWFVVVCAALAVLDSAVRASTGARFGSAILAVGVGLIAYVWGIRPVVLERPDALEVRNPLRTAVLPWSSISDVDSTDVVRVSAGDLLVRCFAIPRRLRPARPRSIPGMPEIVTPAADAAKVDDPVARFESLAASLGSHGDAPAVLAWAPPAVAAMAAGSALALVGLVLMAVS